MLIYVEQQSLLMMGFFAHGMVLQPREDVIDKEFFPLFIASDYF